MKKLVLMFLLIGILFSMGFKATATESTTTTEQETTTEEPNLPDPGVKPGNIFYGFDKFFENIAVKLTLSDEKRAEKLSRIALERLAELNALDAEKVAKYGDELFNEYGLDLEKANLYLQRLVAEGEISEAKLERLERRIQNAEMKQERIRERIEARVSEEVRNQVHEAIRKAKMSIFEQFADIELIEQLHNEEGYGYGILLKLQAISELSETPINDLLAIENAVSVDENNEKHVNIETILEAKGITLEELQAKVKEYRETAKEEMRNKMNEAKQHAKQRKEEIKERIKERQNQKGNKNKD